MSGLTWQEECTAALKQSIAIGGVPGRTNWESFRESARVSDKRILIADADFTEADFFGLDLSRCWIGRSVFNRANLSNVSFYQTIFRECQAVGANISGANFTKSDLSKDGLDLTDAEISGLTTINIRPSMFPDRMSRPLRTLAERSWRQEAHRANEHRSPFFHLVTLISDYGFSFKRILYASAIVITVFAAIFWRFSNSSLPVSILNSLKYFLASGDPYDTCASLSAIGMAESGIGLVLFAIFTSMLVSRFIDSK